MTRISGVRPAPELPEADGPDADGAAETAAGETSSEETLAEVARDGDYTFSRKKLLFFDKEIAPDDAADRLSDERDVTVYETRSFGGVKVHTETKLDGPGDLSDFLAVEGREVDPESALARVGRALDTLEDKGNDMRFVSLGLAAKGSYGSSARLAQTYGGGFLRMSPLAAARRLVHGQPIAIVAEDVVQRTTSYGDAYMTAKVTGQTIIETVEDLEAFFGSRGLPT